MHLPVELRSSADNLDTACLHVGCGCFAARACPRLRYLLQPARPNKVRRCSTAVPGCPFMLVSDQLRLGFDSVFLMCSRCRQLAYSEVRAAREAECRLYRDTVPFNSGITVFALLRDSCIRRKAVRATQVIGLALTVCACLGKQTLASTVCACGEKNLMLCFWRVSLHRLFSCMPFFANPCVCARPCSRPRGLTVWPQPSSRQWRTCAPARPRCNV